MKQTTMCLLSGFFGALFAVACGVVDGAGDKEANANDLSLQIKSLTVECNGSDDLISDEHQEFQERAYNGEIVVSFFTDPPFGSGCFDNKKTYHYIE